MVSITNRLLSYSDNHSVDMMNKWYGWGSVLKDYAKENTLIDVSIANRYDGDFYGLLQYLEIPDEYHYPYLLINNLKSPDKYTGDVRINIVPNDIIRNIYLLLKRQV